MAVNYILIGLNSTEIFESVIQPESVYGRSEICLFSVKMN